MILEMTFLCVEIKLDFNDSYIKRDVLLWINNLMINKSERFDSYETLEAYIRNNMINDITRFISCNRKDMEKIYNHYKETNNNVS